MSKKPKIVHAPDGTVRVERFSPIRRCEHLLAIVTFVTLVLTGFPQKFYEASWAAWLIAMFGGLDSTRFIHRAAGIAFSIHALLHLLVIVVGVSTRRMRLSLLPGPQDLRDAWQNLRFYFGYRRASPPFPKFDYCQKFEYMGMLLGGLVMVMSGLILLYPQLSVTVLFGEVVPASQLMHSNEALLAFLVLLVWHVYGAVLSPEVFPLDKTIFTGYLSVDELRERHMLEFRRLFPEGVADDERGAERPGTGADDGGTKPLEPDADETCLQEVGRTPSP